MTYIDKYMELHPESDRDVVTRDSCPNDVFDIESEPLSYCTFSELSGGTGDCLFCWLRTYRGEKELEV